MTEDELDQLEAGLVRLKGGVCVSSDLEVAAADAIARLRAELAAERERADAYYRVIECVSAERDELRALLREARNIIPRDWAFWARIDAALNKGGDRD